MSFIMIKIWWLNAKKRNVQIQTRIHPKRWILLFITLNSIVLIVYVQYSRFIKGNTKHWTVLPPSNKNWGIRTRHLPYEHKGLAGFFVKNCVYSCRRLTPISIEDDASTDPIPWFDWLSISELKRRGTASPPTKSGISRGFKGPVCSTRKGGDD